MGRASFGVPPRFLGHVRGVRSLGRCGGAPKSAPAHSFSWSSINLLVLALGLLVGGCVAPVVQRCPTCVILDGTHARLPRLRPGVRRLFVVMPLARGFGWARDGALGA